MSFTVLGLHYSTRTPGNLDKSPQPGHSKQESECALVAKDEMVKNLSFPLPLGESHTPVDSLLYTTVHTQPDK